MKAARVLNHTGATSLLKGATHFSALPIFPTRLGKANGSLQSLSCLINKILSVLDPVRWNCIKI